MIRRAVQPCERVRAILFDNVTILDNVVFAIIINVPSLEVDFRSRGRDVLVNAERLFTERSLANDDIIRLDEINVFDPASDLDIIVAIIDFVNVRKRRTKYDFAVACEISVSW